LLQAVDAIETDVFRMVIVQDLNSVAVKDADDEAGGSHRLNDRGARFVVETGTVSLAPSHSSLSYL